MPHQHPASFTVARFGVPETKQIAVIARDLDFLSRRGADLHLVIVELPDLAHPWRDGMPPIGTIRPDLLGKPYLVQSLDITPTIPAWRFMFFGDVQLLDRFTRLTLRATATLRRLMPFVEDRIREAGPDEAFIRGNLWPGMLLDIFENADPITKLDAFETHDRPEWSGARIHTFTHDAFDSSALALMCLVKMYGADEVVNPQPPATPPELTAPSIKPSNPPRPAKQPKNQGKTARCLMAFIEAFSRGETPPTPTELAKIVGCSKSVASRAIKLYADRVKAEAIQDRHDWQRENGYVA